MNNIEKTDGYGRTPLLNAVIDEKIVEVEQLIKSGAKADCQDSLGFSPLHYAAQNSSSEILVLLLRAELNVNCQDKHGNTPLSKAVFAFRGDDSIIQSLITSGADPDIKNSHSVSPRNLADKISSKGISFDLNIK